MRFEMSCDKNEPERKWNEIQVEGKSYMISIIRKPENLKFFLTNLVELWVEQLTEDDILQRFQALNPLLNIDSINYKEYVTEILTNIANHVTEATVNKIQLRKKINGIPAPIKFMITLKKAGPQEFFNNITKPLYATSSELLRQKQILLDVIKEKDDEINICKQEAPKLIKSKPFNTALFSEKPRKSQLDISANTFEVVMNFYSSQISFNDTGLLDTGPSTSKTQEIEPNKKQDVKPQGDKMKVQKERSKSSKKLLSDNTKYMQIPQKRKRKQNKFVLC